MSIRTFVDLQHRFKAADDIPPSGTSAVAIEVGRLSLADASKLESVPGFRPWRLNCVSGLIRSLGDDFSSPSEETFSALVLAFFSCVQASSVSPGSRSDFYAKCLSIAANSSFTVPTMSWARGRVERIIPLCYMEEPLKVAERVFSYICLMGFASAANLIVDDLKKSTSGFNEPLPVSSKPPTAEFIRDTHFSFVVGVMNYAARTGVDMAEAERLWKRFSTPVDERNPLIVVQALSLMGNQAATNIDIFTSLGKVSSLYGVDARFCANNLPAYFAHKISQIRESRVISLEEALASSGDSETL